MRLAPLPRTLALAALAVVSALPLQAQTLVVRARRMLDVERGTMLPDAVVVVEGDRIARVGGGVPPGAEVVDLGDVTLLPGLMDAHTHLTVDIEGDWTNRDVKETAADAALRGARNARRTVEAGFTTVRDVGSQGFADVALEHAIEAGFVPGPRIIPAGHAIGITGGHCDITGFAPGVVETSPAEGVADGPWEAVEAVRYQVKHGARVVKICATAGVLSFEGPVGAQQLSGEEMVAVVEEAHRHGLRVAAHAHGAEGILAAVRAGVTSIEHGSILTDEILDEMKERGTYLVPTQYVADAIDLPSLPPPIRAKAEYVLPLMKESFRRAVAAGVKVAFGTDAGVFPHGDNARELAVYVERGGMSPLEAIRSATMATADLFGVDDRGRIAEGLLADLIAVEGNP
ncbi:MAG TPA: amidohydrolase family protein, partial [Longimicrobiales bacterium]|nr:amidohydrolase family protein [Longimicrobiales bacterium]